MFNLYYFSNLNSEFIFSELIYTRFWAILDGTISFFFESLLGLLLLIVTAISFIIILFMTGEGESGAKEESSDKNDAEVKQDNPPKGPGKPAVGIRRPRPGQREPPPNPPETKPIRPDKVPGLE